MAQWEEREWLRPEIHPEMAAGVPAAERAAMFELRPLSLGEVLDRTFALYRSRFWLFASITAVPASVQVVVQAISLGTVHAYLRGGLAGLLRPVPVHRALGAQIASWVALLIFFLVSALTHAATALAVSEVYLNRTIGAKEALAAALKHWSRWIGIVLWQAGSMLWIPMLGFIPGLVLLTFGARQGNNVLVGLGVLLVLAAVLGGFPAGVVLYLRNALAIPAAVVERLTVRAAMRRSKVLAAGTKGRIFVVLLIAVCLYYVVAILESPASLLMLFAPKQQHYLAEAITLVIGFVGRTVVFPVALIGLTLVYFDQRVRNEALDLQLLLEASHGGASGAALLPEAQNGSRAPGEEFAPLG